LRAAQIEKPIALTCYKPLESFFGCREKGCFVMEGSQRLSVLAVWKARYMRLLGLLQHTPSEKHWEAGRLLPG